MNGAWMAALVSAGLALTLGQSACSPAQSKAGGRRLIVLGIDGMDPVFVDKHWSSLPNLDRLRKQGGFRKLATTIPPQSPVAWSTFITGMDPGGHGVYDFIHRNPETRMPFSSMAETAEGGRSLSIGPYVLPLSAGTVRTHRQGKAFWQILSERGVPVTILRMPTNFPPVDCEGQSLAGMGTPDLRGTFGTFTFFTDAGNETTRHVPGGRIVKVRGGNHRYRLKVEGPQNSLRKDRVATSIELVVDVDPAAPVARLRAGGSTLVLHQGEWSGWLPVEFELIPYLKSAAGMVRVYAKQLHPGFQFYVSPVNIDPSRPELPISDPASYSGELARSVGPYYTQGMAEDTAALRQGVFSRREFIRQSRLVSEEHLKLLRHGMRNFRDGLLFFHFFGVDQNSHMLWGRFDNELLESYQLVDRSLGWVLDHSGGAQVVVMSDHGFSTFDRAVHVNAWLMKEGFLTLNDPAKAGNDELFVHVDWSRTQAYSVGLNGLYLNLAGREPDGGVIPGAEADSVIRKIGDRLTAFRDPDTGRPVVTTVYRAREVYSGAALDQAPDMLIGFAPGYRSSWQTALGAVPKQAIENNNEAWIGDHCIAAEHVPGVLITNRATTVADPRLEDLPVSILAYFGVSRPAAMKGRSIF